MLRYTLLAAMTMMASSLFGDCGGCADPCGNCDSCCNPCGGCSDPCGMDCGCDTCCDPCNTCCSAPCCCEPCDFCPPEPPETCAYNAPKFYDLKCAWDMFVTGSFVYMQAKEENLGYAEAGILESQVLSADGNTQTQTLKEIVPEFTFDYEPAFKVGLGFTFGCDNWDFYAEYFRYHADVGSSSFSPQAVGGGNMFVGLNILIAFQAEPFEVTSFTSSAKWRLELDMVDFNLRRKYYVGKCLIMQPSIGIKFGWIDQTENVNYSLTRTIEDDDQDIPTVFNADVVNSSESWAVGAKVALDTEWTFCGSFRLFGNTSLAILYTDYDSIKKTATVTQENLVVVQDQPTFENTNLSLGYSLCFLRPDASITLGLGWGDYWCCNDWYFDLSLGYEFHTYWNQNVMPQVNNFTQEPSSLGGDLYMHGLVLTARLDF